MEKYPDLDIRVMEMKTPDIRKALLTGEADAIIASMLDDAALTEETFILRAIPGLCLKEGTVVQARCDSYVRCDRGTALAS